MRWYQASEIYRLDQPSGKQYSFGHGPESTSGDGKKECQNPHLKMEKEILKKYLELKEELKKK